LLVTVVSNRSTLARLILEGASLRVSKIRDYKGAKRTCERVIADFTDDERAQIEARKLLAGINVSIFRGFLNEGNAIEARRAHAMVSETYGDLMSRASNTSEFLGHLKEALKVMNSGSIELGEYAKALIAAKRRYDTADNSRELEEAVRMVATALRAMDGNLVRVNAFLKFQKFGPAGADGVLGTDDDLANPLSDIIREVTNNPDVRAQEDRRKASFEACLAKVGNSRDDWRRKGYLYLVVGDARRALSELKRAFLRCPINERDIQSATNDVLVGLRALHGHVFVGDVFLEYQQYGPKGKDGKSNIEDPLKEF